MFVKRLIKSTFIQALAQFPAILVTGPRQAGKTTLILHEAPKNAAYVSFDDPLEREFARSDPNGFLDRFGSRPVILDEIQYVPEILPYLKLRIDRNRQQYGKWLLTGSQQFHLMKNVSESLAGRVAILELLPFSYPEVREHVPSLESIIWNGGYPEPSLYPDKRDLWLRSYVQTYVERDVRQLQNIHDLRIFGTFLGSCAARHGQTFNTAEFSRDCGITQPTVKAWGGILEASYLSFFLQPYHTNFGKRLVKTPKLFMLDPAIVCYLTRQPNGEAALSGPMGGALFEGLIIAEAVKTFAALGRKPDIYFWRSREGLEVDLLIQAQGKLFPVEIKLTATPTVKHAGPLDHFRKIAGCDKAETGLLVCRVKEERPLPNGNMALPWERFGQWLMERLTVL